MAIVVVQLRNGLLDAPVAVGCCGQGSRSVSDGESSRSSREHKKSWISAQVFQSISHSHRELIWFGWHLPIPKSESLGTL